MQTKQLLQALEALIAEQDEMSSDTIKEVIDALKNDNFFNDAVATLIEKI